MPLGYFWDNEYIIESGRQDIVNTSAQVSETKQWIKNPTFESPIEPTWFWKNGTEGDNSDILAVSTPGQADYKVLGEEKTVTLIYGTPNSSTSPDWKIVNNGDFLLPYNVEMNSSGAYISHYLDESTGPGQVNNFPSVHFKTNVSMPVDMSDYVITNVSLEVDFNASVDINVDSYYDWNQTDNTIYIDTDKFIIGDSANFYVELSDISSSYPFRVAEFETRDLALGEGDFIDPDILTIPDTELNYTDEQDLITALNSALENNHQNFTITLGLDVYCEDNKAGGGGDQDYWEYLIFKTFNITVSYVKKIDQSTTLSWNQKGNKINGSNHQITDANLNFQYLIDQNWSTSAPLSEFRVLVNNKSFNEGIIKLSSFNTSYQDLKVGGIDVTSLISTDVNISISLELYIKDIFTLDSNITISIDNVYLNISYVRTFSDSKTDLQIFANNNNITSDPYFTIAEGDDLNITVKYEEDSIGSHITNASIQLEGKVSGILNESFVHRQYSIVINVSDLGVGTKLLTISASKDNFETKTFQFLVDVTERETEMQLFLNNVQKFDNSSIAVESNENIEITVYFQDFITKNYLKGASVNLLGLGELNQTIDYYNITISGEDLDKGINVLTILAQLENYQSKSIQFFIEVFDISTKLQLFLNNEEKTLDPNMELPIGGVLNITVKYLDNHTGIPVNNSLIQLVGEGLSTFFTEFPIFDQHSIIINSTTLNLGIKLFTIVAQAIDFQVKTVDLRIGINRISTSIGTESGESFINADSGENIRIRVVLNNTNFGGVIKGALVTYRWGSEQGELTDDDNDGIYEVVLKNVPTGSSIIRITAFAGDEYYFETYEIALNVVKRTEPDLTLLIFGLSGGILSLGLAIVLYQKHFKYPPLMRKVRKLRKSITKGRKVKPLLLQDREKLIDANFQDIIQILKLEEIEQINQKKMNIKSPIDEEEIKKKNIKNFKENSLNNNE